MKELGKGGYSSFRLLGLPEKSNWGGGKGIFDKEGELTVLGGA